MSALAGFWTCLAATLVFLGCTVATGLKAKRKWHLMSVACTVVLLAASVYYALEVGREYDVHAAGIITPIHLTLARSTAVGFLLTMLSGLRTIFFPKKRPLHRKLAFLVIAMTVLTAVTGTIMLCLSPPIAGQVSAGD